MVSH
jgi:threonine dehydratase